jgi:hypothetical protein
MHLTIRVLVAVAVGLLLSVTPALAADVDGRWVGSIDAPNGAMPVAFFALPYTGVVARDQIKMTINFMGMVFELTVKRPQQP